MNNDDLPPIDFQATDALLTDLLAEAERWGGYLSGGQPINTSAEAVRGLLESKVEFGNPNSNLVRLTETLFAESGIELTPLFKQQLQERYDFYYMTVTVDLIPRPGTQFWRLVCELDFGPKGQNEPIIHRLFPSDRWQSVMTAGVGMDISLNGNLDWTIGVDSNHLANLAKTLPGEIQTNLVNRSAISGFLSIPARQYDLGSLKIVASGTDNSRGYWRITAQDLQKVSTVKLGTVFKVPKGTDSIALQGRAWAEPNMQWFTEDLRDVARELSDRFKQLLRKKEANASQLARWSAEKWEPLLLPAA